MFPLRAEQEIEHQLLHSLDHLITSGSLAAGGAGSRHQGCVPMSSDHVAHEHQRGQQLGGDGQRAWSQLESSMQREVGVYTLEGEPLKNKQS